jgi:DNA-binding transcriptional MocR family regulator
MTGPSDALAAVAARRQNGQGWSSRLLQRILLSLLTDDAACSAVAAARQEYARRRRVVVEELAAAGVTVRGTDGINIWVPVHDESAAIVRLASQGIGVTPGAPFALRPTSQDHIRVTVGLLADRHAEVAAQIAAAAQTSGWRARGR